jgi:head-tail adaptor
MSLVDSADLDAMRAAQETLLPTACTISRRTLTAVGDGTYTETWATTSTTVCRDVPTSGRELDIASRLTTQMARTVTLPHDAAVRSEDRIVIGTRTLEVLAILSSGSWETARRVLCAEVT